MMNKNFEMNEEMMTQVNGGETVKGRPVHSVSTRGEGVCKTPDEVVHWGLLKKLDASK